MTTGLVVLPQNEEWYQSLVDDCKSIITEAVFTSRWALVEGNWLLGERIVTDTEYKKWEQGKAGLVFQGLGKAIGISKSALYYAVQLYNQYPQLNSIPEGKNITMNKLITKYLPRPKENKLEIPTPQGKYRAIVIDPPWPMAKIQREVRPNQVDMDYSTMTIEAIEALPITGLAFEDGCHIYLWSTHKQLPSALNLFEVWGVEYECLLTWVKNVGITPYSWMYSTEHCLFGRIGNLPLLKLGKRLDFAAKVREHSRKPDEFYDLVAEVSPGPRIDMFSREKREGFDQYGTSFKRRYETRD